MHDSSANSTSLPNSTWRGVMWALLLVTFGAWLFVCLSLKISGPDVYGITMLGLTVDLCAMIGFWAVMGAVGWRWMVIAVSCPMMGFVSGLNSGSAPEFHFFCLSTIAIIALTTLILRVWKGRLQMATGSAVYRDGLQFGIKDLLIWTTAIAVFLGMGRFILTHPEWFGLKRIQNPNFLMIFGLAVSMSIAIVVNIWAMLGSRISILKLFTLILVTFGAAVVNYFLFPNEYFFSFVILVAQFLILLKLFVLRRQGFRFVKANS